MEAKSGRGGWVRVPMALRVVAVLVGSWGLGAMLLWLPLFPPPLDAGELSVVLGLAGLAAAVGILRAEPWGRALGLAVTTIWIAQLAITMARSATALDAPDQIGAALLSWVIAGAPLAFMTFQLALRWPEVSTSPTLDPAARRRTLSILVVVLLLVLGSASMLRPSGPAPFMPPEQLGPVRSGGHVSVPASGFSLDVPSDWTVETPLQPHVLVRARPGEAWEALRATDPARRQTCSLYVAVAPAGETLQGYSVGSTSGDGARPRWSGSRDMLVLEVPGPDTRIELGSDVYGFVGGGERRLGEGLDPPQDVAYALVCGSDTEQSFEALAGSLAYLPLADR